MAAQPNEPRLRLDGRGLFSLGLFALTVAVLAMLGLNPKLADNHLFATLAQAVVLTGLINSAAPFYFGATKNDPRHVPAGSPPPTSPPPSAPEGGADPQNGQPQ